MSSLSGHIENVVHSRVFGDTKYTEERFGFFDDNKLKIGKTLSLAVGTMIEDWKNIEPIRVYCDYIKSLVDLQLHAHYYNEQRSIQCEIDKEFPVGYACGFCECYSCKAYVATDSLKIFQDAVILAKATRLIASGFDHKITPEHDFMIRTAIDQIQVTTMGKFLISDHIP